MKWLMEQLKRLSRWLFGPGQYKPQPNCRRYNFTKNGWGHNLSRRHDPYVYHEWTGELTNEVYGIMSPRPNVGDEIVFPTGLGDWLCIFTEIIRYGGDPCDWLDAKIRAVGPLADFEQNEITDEVSTNALIAPMRAAGHSDKEIENKLGIKRGY